MITKNDVLNLQAGLNAVGKLKGTKFAFAVAKNAFLIEGEVKAIQEAAKANDTYVTYDKERVELAKKHSKKDENGEPKSKKMIENGKEVEVFDLIDQEAFDKDLDSLKETHKDAIAEREAQLKELDEMLKQESDIKLFKIKPEDLPEGITPQELVGIYKLLED